MLYHPGDNIGYFYSFGLSALHPSKPEFVCLDCSRELINQIQNDDKVDPVLLRNIDPEAKLLRI
jgi:hypothetical protein